MAGSVSDFSLPNSSFFNIYNDGGAVARTSPAPVLPGGRCNFVDLTHGANGPRCGCRRFWSRGALGVNGYAAVPSAFPQDDKADQTAFCMCSHHACFHDDTQGMQTQGPFVAPATPVATTTGQENEKPRSAREPLTPVLPDLSFQMPAPAGPSTDLHTFNQASFTTNSHQGALVPGAETSGRATGPSIPDTLSWVNLIQSQPDNQVDVLPPIPSQCLLPPSQASSTTSSARIRYLKPFGGVGLDTLSGVRSKLRESLPVEEVAAADGGDDDLLAPTVDASVDDLQTVTNTPRSTRRTHNSEIRSATTTPRPSRQEFQELSSTVQSHEQRLDRLETVSFEHSHEDCHDQHDRDDLRITELESRVEELEKTLSDSSSVTTSQHRSRRPGIDESTASVVSVSTDASGRSDRAELYSELQALKAQLSHLQASSFPCYASPWEVEVVFLPFPLKGVWFDSREFPSQRQSSGLHVDVDQWTQLPNSSSTLEQQSPVVSEWAGPELDSDWLLPRACPPGKTIDQRLRSRGLIKNVMVRGPDARSVQQAISAAFGTSFRTLSRMQANVYHGSTNHHRVATFFGLQQPWVPLRKIHKDSRLRFLTPAEMVTPTSWDVSFLSSSVVMKATGTQRLFITQPEAYLQDQDAYDNGWSWQRLRELSRVYPDSQSSQQDVPEADAMENCWGWNDRLDESSSSQNTSLSLSLRQAAQPRLRSKTPSQLQIFTSRSGQSPSLTTSRSRAGSPMVLKERKSSVPRPPHVRTTSMPPTVPLLVSPSQIRRRITSATFGNAQVHPYERRPSPQVFRASTGSSRALLKESRRRSTRSPSVPLSARLRNTPRWSTASIASPLPEPFAIIASAGDAEAACRQTTPFYYATPYSNAPYVEARSNRPVVEPDDDHGSGTDYSFEDAGHRSQESSEDEEGDSQMLDLGHPRRAQHDSGDEGGNDAQRPPPEDEPWPGIEDTENRDPEALAFDSVDIYEDEDAMSDILDTNVDAQDVDSQKSSAPSEYPSTQSAWVDGAEEFSVYEDGHGR